MDVFTSRNLRRHLKQNKNMEIMKYWSINELII